MVAPFTPIANISTSDLFNELHRRLLNEADEHNVRLMRLAYIIDSIHHDYTDLKLQSNEV